MLSKSAGKRKADPVTQDTSTHNEARKKSPLPNFSSSKPSHEVIREERGPDGVLLAQVLSNNTRRIYAGSAGSERIVRVEKALGKGGAMRVCIYEGCAGQERLTEVRHPDGSRNFYAGPRGAEVLNAKTQADGVHCTYVTVRGDDNNLRPVLATKKACDGTMSYYAASFAGPGQNPLLRRDSPADERQDCASAYYLCDNDSDTEEDRRLVYSERFDENDNLEQRFYSGVVKPNGLSARPETRLIHLIKTPHDDGNKEEHEYFLSKNEKIPTTITMANGTSVSGTTLEGVEGAQRCCCVCLGNKMDTLTALLPCCHTTCAECASKVALSGDRRCPQCRGALRGLLSVIL